MKYVELIVLAINVLVRIAEAFSGHNTGESKKSFVTNTIRSIIGLFARFSTGGQQGTWQGISAIFDGAAESVGDLVDVIVHGLYNVEDEDKYPTEFDEVDP